MIRNCYNYNISLNSYYTSGSMFSQVGGGGCPTQLTHFWPHFPNSHMNMKTYLGGIAPPMSLYLQIEIWLTK